VGDPTQCHAVAIDGRAPKFDGGIVTRLDCVPFSVVVNRDGDRFYDEGEDVWPKRYAIWGRLVAAQPDQVAYAIIDAKALELFMPSVFPPVEADTLEGLAQKLGLPQQAARDGRRLQRRLPPGDFYPTELDGLSTEGLTPPKTNWARPIDRAALLRLFAAPRRDLHLSRAEGRRDRARSSRRWPLANVWAAGEIMAGSILGQGYLAGLRHDHRHRLRTHRRTGGRAHVLDHPPTLTATEEARRQIEICNACRYCEGYCDVFPAMTRQRAFSDGDITQLANLCHNCRGCYYACQYTEPHEFA
jgi:precorrin 3B synthase CobZ